jgi:hypothetical protein
MRQQVRNKIHNRLKIKNEGCAGLVSNEATVTQFVTLDAELRAHNLLLYYYL